MYLQVPMVPLLMENCAECTYPVSEEVSMGFIFVGSNVLVINRIRILVNMCIYVRIFKMHVYGRCFKNLIFCECVDPT